VLEHLRGWRRGRVGWSGWSGWLDRRGRRDRFRRASGALLQLLDEAPAPGIVPELEQHVRATVTGAAKATARVRADIGQDQLVEAIDEDAPPGPPGEVPDSEEEQAAIGDDRDITPAGGQALEAAGLRNPRPAPDDDRLTGLQTGNRLVAQPSLGCLA
jgi:hypothetical protein